MSRTARGAVAVVGPAVLLGVLAADGWRTHVPVVEVVGSLQAPWVLLPFAVAAWLGAGRLRCGALLGACTGFTAIASYYVYEALAYTLHAATSQLTKSHGVFWVLGATVGGAVAGVLGSVATASRHRVVPALAWCVVAAVPAAEALLLVRFPAAVADPTTLRWVPAGLVVTALAVLTLAVRRCGRRAVARAAPGALLLAGTAFAVLVWAEEHLAYLTF